MPVMLAAVVMGTGAGVCQMSRWSLPLQPRSQHIIYLWQGSFAASSDIRSLEIKRIIQQQYICTYQSSLVAGPRTDTVQDCCSDIQSPAWRRTTLPQFASACRQRAWSTSTPLCRIEPSADSAVQTVNRRRSSVSGRSSTVLEQASWQCHVGQFIIGFSAATETHSVPAVIPRHYPVTFLNCNTHSGPSSGITT